MSIASLLFIFVPILLVQGTWMFIDARKKGALAWLWGIWGLIQTPTPFIVYYFVVMRPYQKKYKKEGD